MAALLKFISTLALCGGALLHAQGIPPSASILKPPGGISAQVYQIYEASKKGDDALADRLVRAHKVSVDGTDRIAVVVIPKQTIAEVDVDALRRLKCEVIAESRSYLRISSPISQLPNLPGIAGVRLVRLPWRPQMASTISQGVSLVGASTAHSRGVLGTGIRVVIIDTGFEGLREAVRHGDLPAQWRFLDQTGEGLESSGLHGTGVAEIIHDVAPEAELYYYKINDLLDFENAVDLAIRSDADIINYSGHWFGTGFGDGQGVACDAVNRAADSGIIWVNSAGNQANKVYNHLFTDPDEDGWHNISGEDEVLTLSDVDVGEEIVVWLKWNDWPLTTDDYDLVLTKNDEQGNVEIIARSDGAQFHDEPVEVISYDVTEVGIYGVSIRKMTSARVRLVRLESVHHEVQQSPSLRGTIGIPADARGAIAVGAVNHRDWISSPEPEVYSSRGPTFDGRVKPDIAAPDGVRSFSYQNGFPGTSAAAPHVAGVAALIKSTDPLGMSASTVRSTLLENAMDVGEPGKDNDFGWGKLDLRNVTLVRAMPDLGITPSQLHFTDIGVGTSSTRIIRISNDGRGYLQLLEIETTNSTRYIPSVSRSPFTLLDTFESARSLDDWGKSSSASWRWVDGKAGLSSSDSSSLGTLSPNVYLDEGMDISVDTEWLSGDETKGYGISFCRSADGQYRFAISGRGSYKLTKWDGIEFTSLTDWTRSDAITNRGRNTIRVRKIVSLMKLYINNVFVEDVADTSFTEGWVRLYADSDHEIAFDNFQVIGGDLFFPQSVQPMGSIEFGLTYFAAPDIASSSQLRITTDDPDTPVTTIGLSAEPFVVTSDTPAVIGDFNADGSVDFSDFLAFAGHFGTATGQSRYDVEFDLNHDDLIDFSDFLIFAHAFGS
jgi:subtilisin family serine protease